jgi:hypothetical protein
LGQTYCPPGENDPATKKQDNLNLNGEKSIGYLAENVKPWAPLQFFVGNHHMLSRGFIESVVPAKSQNSETNDIEG